MTTTGAFEYWISMMRSTDPLTAEQGFQGLRPLTHEHIHELVALFDESTDSAFRDYLFVLLLESDLPQAQPVLRAVELGNDVSLRRLYAGFGRRDDLRPAVAEPEQDDGPILRMRRKVGTLAGFPIYLHVSVLIWAPFLLLGWSTWTIMGILFASVLIHEFAHAFTCRLVGMGSGSVTLWFAGGLFFPTRLTQMPHQMAWTRRLWFVMMIAAGPISNIVLATAAQLAWLFTNAEWLKQAADINLSLAFFNLIPMPPLDGEKIVVGLGLSWLSRRGVYAALSALLVALIVGAIYVDVYVVDLDILTRVTPYLVFGFVQAVRLALQTDADVKKQERAVARAVARERTFIGDEPDPS